MEVIYRNVMQKITGNDVAGLVKAEKSYGDSWKKRGGIGAYMMLVRKSDRMELAVKKLGFDIFKAIASDKRPEGIIDDIRDLRRYLLLVETEMVTQGVVELDNHRDNKVDELNDIEDKEKILAEAAGLETTTETKVFYFAINPYPPEWAKNPEYITTPHSMDDGWRWTRDTPMGQEVEHWPGQGTPIKPKFAPGEELVDGEYSYSILQELPPQKKMGLWMFAYEAIKVQKV